jgi:DNA-binding transcriptional ArsR family regulator
MPRILTPGLLDLVADRFKALSDPARLRLLSALRDGERSVSELVEATELSQANASKHLTLLHTLGFVKRRREGSWTYYALGDRDVMRLCDLMCGRIEAEVERRARLLG